ncbi:MAG: hypothetical protein HUU20_29220, partial [Pirellulales bacterium]|nr:hypothetical protein [Pirellulales bacterium]
LAPISSDDPRLGPMDRPVVRTETLAEWNFNRDAEGWAAQQQCELSARDGVLVVRGTGHDPYFHRPVDLPGGRIAVFVRLKSRDAGRVALYWTTDQSPDRGEDKVTSFPVKTDGQWHDCAVRFTAPGRLSNLRLDPGNDAGETEIDGIRISVEELHPLSVESVEVGSAAVRYVIRNHGRAPIEATAASKPYTIPGEGQVTVERPIERSHPLEAAGIEVRSGSLPPVRRSVFLHHETVQTEWIERPLETGNLQIARDGTCARLLREGRMVAAIAPLVHCEGEIPALKLAAEQPAVRFEGPAIAMSIGAGGDEVAVSIQGDRPCEGPVVRALGPLEQGLFAGLEYLGKGERSSSKLDVETEEHLRFVPDPMKVTFPLMALVTDRGAVAMTWKDMELQPVYATPNVFDATADHRMAIRGRRIEATVRIGQGPLEETIFWYVKTRGLPPLPEPPRSKQDQWALCLKALNGPLRSEAGWGHCAEEHWQRAPHADHASTIWRLTGAAPELPRLVPGGAHVPNDAIYFVTGRAAQWKEIQEQRVRGTLQQQRPDGSFRYDGKYRRGHHEDTASGVCARPAWMLLEYASMTGDREALDAGVRALEFMKRFHTPRGAQVWEVPLHTPDQLASAYLVWAYVRGYELTGNKDYLAEARRWALSGIPFTYLWSCKPVMLYATPPVFGATNWAAPCWIGLPVQWVGGVYAYALTKLAPYDDSLDWNHLARGILISAEQQQYPDGKWAGLLPDSLVLQTQERRPWNINPCAVVSLRMALDGELDSLAVAVDGKHRIVAPFPVTLREGKARIQARPGVKYQVLIDGEKIVDVTSQGDDVVGID